MSRSLESFVFALLLVSLVFANNILAQETETKTTLKKFAYSTPAMGVKLNIVVYCTEADVDSTIEAAVGAVSTVNEVFSDYSTDSEVGKLPADGDQWVQVSDDFFELLDRSHSISEKTCGNFDVTLGALTKNWRTARKESRLPETELLRSALSVSGIDKVELDRDKKRIRYPKGLKFDFGGIGKGYAADQALAAMKKLGFGAALVDLGGDIAIGDPPPGKAGWKVAIAARPEHEAEEDNVALVNARFIEISNCGVATSGDVEQFVEVDGVRYSHLLDPKTGLGIQRQVNVTVIAGDAGLADALASAYSVMPYETALENRKSFPNVKLLLQELVDGKVVERHSDDFLKFQNSKD